MSDQDNNKSSLDALKEGMEGKAPEDILEETVEEVVEVADKSKEEVNPHDPMAVARAHANKLQNETEEIIKEHREFKEAHDEYDELDEDERFDAILADYQAENDIGKTKDEISSADELDNLILMMETYDGIPIVDTDERPEIDEDFKKVIPVGYVKSIASNDYVEGLEDITGEEIKASKKGLSTKARSIAVRRYITRGDVANVPMPNSGIQMSFAGAGVNELIGMMNASGKTPASNLLAKLNWVFKHVIDSTLGGLSMSKALPVLSSHDIEVLYYGLFAASFPDNNEFPIECSSCGETYRVNVHTRDLLLNPDEFNKELIAMEKVETVKELLATSNLNDCQEIVLEQDGIVIIVGHPSIKTFLTVIDSIGTKMTRTMQDNLTLLYHMKELRLNDPEYGTMVFKPTNIEEIKDIDAILTALPPESQEAIDTELQELIPAMPSFGIPASTCEHCDSKNHDKPMSMSNLLFSKAGDMKERAALKSRIAFLEKKKMKESKSTPEI